jgi:hypothetical protein
MNCSLTKFYTLLGVAIALLVVAIVMGIFFVNIPGLIIAIASVVGVTILIPILKAELEAYEKCRGQSLSCHIAPAIDWLGLAASVLSVISFTIALLLVTNASTLLSNFFTAWLGLALQGAAQAVALAGVAGCAAALGYLGMLYQSLSDYVTCKDKEDAGSGPPRGPSGSPGGPSGPPIGPSGPPVGPR